jgi:hypothetical protein
LGEVVVNKETFIGLLAEALTEINKRLSNTSWDI